MVPWVLLGLLLENSAVFGHLIHDLNKRDWTYGRVEALSVLQKVSIRSHLNKPFPRRTSLIPRRHWCSQGDNSDIIRRCMMLSLADQGSSITEASPKAAKDNNWSSQYHHEAMQMPVQQYTTSPNSSRECSLARLRDYFCYSPGGPQCLLSVQTQEGREKLNQSYDGSQTWSCRRWASPRW